MLIISSYSIRNFHRFNVIVMFSFKLLLYQYNNYARATDTIHVSPLGSNSMQQLLLHYAMSVYKAYKTCSAHLRILCNGTCTKIRCTAIKISVQHHRHATLCKIHLVVMIIIMFKARSQYLWLLLGGEVGTGGNCHIFRSWSATINYVFIVTCKAL